MKTIIAILLSALAIFHLYGCNQDEQQKIKIVTYKKEAAIKLPVILKRILHSLEAFDAVDIPSAVSIFSEDHQCILSNTNLQPLLGRDHVTKAWKKVHIAFPDVKISPKRIFGSDNLWIIEAVVSGTHQGKFLEQEASMNKVVCQLALFAWIENDQIKKSFLCGNPLSVLKQINASDKFLPIIPEIPTEPKIIAASASAENIRKVESFYQIFKEGNWPALSSLMALDVVVSAYGDGKKISGIQAITQAIQKERQAFEGEIEIMQSVSSGPYVAAFVKISGKLKHAVGPLKSVGKSFSEYGIDIFHFENGKIKKWDNYRNLMDLMKQLDIKIEI
jgi:predicted ester cyclase